MPANVSQELTGDAARFAGQEASAGDEKSKPASEPRQLSSRLLGPLSSSITEGAQHE